MMKHNKLPVWHSETMNSEGKSITGLKLLENHSKIRQFYFHFLISVTWFRMMPFVKQSNQSLQ